MKKKIVGVFSVVCCVLIGMMMQHEVFAADAPQSQKKPVNRRRATTSSRHRKGKEAKTEVVQKDEKIENIESFVNEFDHKAKQKAVDNLLVRGVDFCKQHSLQAVCHAFTHTQDFIEGSLYLFLLDIKGVVYAHGDQSNLLWKSLWDRRDMFGNLVIQSMVALAHAGGGILTHELDGAVRVTSVKRVDIEGKEYVIGCGYYPHSKEYAVVGLVKGAVALFNQYVAEKRDVAGAFSDMSYPLSPQFVFGDLYLYALDFSGNIRAQADRPGLIGSNSLNYADSTGKKYNQDIIKMLKDKEKGDGVWFTYTSKNALKRAYAEKVQDSKGNYYFIASGYYPEITREMAVDLVRRGYQFMKASGVSRAEKAFNDEHENQYRNGDLGLFLYDMKGKCLAHGVDPDHVGQNQFDIKDADGRYYVREFINQANAGGGWVTYKVNNSFESAYVEKVDMGIGDFVIGTGMFPVSKPETMTLLVKSALGYVQNHSMDEFLQRMVNRSDEFVRGDLFMYVFDLDGFCYGWGDSYKLIWQNLINWKDDNGKPFVKMMIEASSQGPEHLVLNLNKCPRVNYFEQIEKDGKKYLIGSGFYK